MVSRKYTEGERQMKIFSHQLYTLEELLKSHDLQEVVCKYATTNFQFFAVVVTRSWRVTTKQKTDLPPHVYRSIAQLVMKQT